MSAQKPIELILARNLLASLTTPAFLVENDGTLIFYNDAAAALVGRRFEETGRLGPEQWGGEFGPFDADGNPVPYDELPLTRALRQGRASHARFRIRSTDGTDHEVELSALPIVATTGARGAMVIFWPIEDQAPVG
jgi:PAS domain-containing protein